MFWKKWFPKKDLVESPYGAVPTSKTFSAKSPPQQLRPLSETEDQHRLAYAAAAAELAANLHIGVPGKSLSADDLDLLLKVWNPSVGTTDEFNHVSYLIGFAFGDYLVGRYHLRWVVLTDEIGSDFAVTDSTGICTSFPISTVAKRLETGDRDFLGPVAFILQRQLQELSRQA